MYRALIFLLTLKKAILHNGNHANQSKEQLIYRGYEIGIEQHSYATFLHFEATRPNSCGASLIMVQAVLTAAHCVDELRYKSGKINAYFGATVPKDGIVRAVVDYSIHPKYNEVTGKMDLAVAFLSSRVPLRHTIKKIPLAVVAPSSDTLTFAAGWGKQPGKLPDLRKFRSLRATKQRVIPTKECRKYSGHTITTLCAKAAGYFSRGDYGSGLIVKTPSHLLVGVLSHVSDGIAIYGSVPGNRDWIIGACFSLFRKNCPQKKKLHDVTKCKDADDPPIA